MQQSRRRSGHTEPTMPTLFIRNKADDFIAELAAPDAAHLPEKIVLSGFSRDAALLRAEAGSEQPGLRPTLVMLSCRDERGRREVRKFREFLCERKKAATSTSGGATAPLIAVLPRGVPAGSSGEEYLALAVYQPMAGTEAPGPAAGGAAGGGASKAAPPAAADPDSPKKLPSWAPQARQESPKRAGPAWGPGAKRTSSAGIGASAALAAAVHKKRRVATMAEKVALGSQQYRDLGPDETLQLPAAISWDTDRMVLMDPVSGRCIYYQDKGKRYRFITDAEEGMPLLCDLVTTNRSLLGKNDEIMAQRGDPVALKQEGYHIYSEKPTLKSAVSSSCIQSPAHLLPLACVSAS